MIKVPLHKRSLVNINNCPKVYISRITLSDYSSTNPSKNEQQNSSLINNSRTLRSEVVNDASFSKKTKVHLNMLSYLTENQIISFSINPELKIRIVKNESPELYESISSDPSNWLSGGGPVYDASNEIRGVSYIDIQYNQFFKNVSFLNGINTYGSKENNLRQLLKEQKFSEITFRNGIKRYAVPLEASFIIDGTDIYNLSFFVFPHINLTSDYSSRVGVVNKIMLGPITSENVYIEGKTTKNLLS